MLLGREVECRALDRLLADARAGQSGVLALVGEAGIGKTALLDYARASASGMGVLRARGIESEAQVPFGGLLELLRPALVALDRIPGPQAAALAGALALRPAEVEGRFAVGAATLSLLATHADAAPLLLLVDDAHWLDGSSAEALLFAVRRLVADPIAVLLTVREDEPSLLDGADLPVLQIEGLAPAAAAALLERESPEPVTTELADRLYRSTAGNPLALLELIPEAAHLAGAPLAGPVPVSTSIARAFLRRFETLSERARSLTVLVAANDGGQIAVFEQAAAALGLDPGDLGPAESVGLVSITQGVIEFRHPLARSAVYGAAPPDERRAAHRALADALPDRDIDRRAWHLATAAVGTDEAASAALRQAGKRAHARSAYAVAAMAFERAARLASDPSEHSRLLYEAADSAWLAGQNERSLALLDEARDEGLDVRLAARIEHLGGRIAMRRGPVMKGHALLVAGATLVATEEPGLAVEMLAEAVEACFYAGDTSCMLETAARAVELSPGNGERAAFFAAMAQGMALVFAGQGEAGADALRRATTILEGADGLRDDPLLLGWVALPPLWLREADTGKALVDRAVEAARERAALGQLPRLLWHIAREAAGGEAWSSADASYSETVRIARETGERTELAIGLAGLAWLEARLGREESCRSHAAAARELCAELGIGVHDTWAIAALGDLELGLGRPAAAIVHFEEQQAALTSLGVADADLLPAPELVDAYLRVGRREDAAAASAAFGEQAVAKGQPWGLARAARCRGLLAPDDELDDAFGEALLLHGRTPDVFETARTHLAYGARLRRTRRRKRSREELRAALEIFDRLGAAPWADLTATELAATGETARRRDTSTLDTLTAQELQIGLLLADGKTTRETAAALFLSPKTIEYHLRHIYRKLDVRSRAELADALASRKPTEAQLTPPGG
jgi:DNA-binding CsgD family transcriptional regulator